MARPRPLGGRRRAAQARPDHVAGQRGTDRRAPAAAAAGRARGASTSTSSRPMARACPCASCIGLPRRRQRRAGARARAQPRAGRGRGSRRRRAQIRAAVPLGTHRHRHGRSRKAPSARPTPPSCGCSAVPLDGAPAGKVSLARPRRATRATRRLREALDGGDRRTRARSSRSTSPLRATTSGAARFYLSPIEQAEGESEAAIAYAIDTTEQRALEMQIAQSQKMQAVGQLAGGIAHDFNNMLTAIIGFSDFLLMNHRPTDPAFQDIMNIKQNANRAAGLVRQLLAFSRQQTLRPQVLAARRRAVGAVDPARPSARREYRAQARVRAATSGRSRPICISSSR